MTSDNLIKWLLLVILVAGCDDGLAQRRGAGAREEALRVRTDTARGRLWVLGLDDVRVYDAAGKRLVRRIVLPGWSVARYVCDPDLALDASGAAIVSSNVQPRLWRVDGESFAVTERQVALVGREHWDTGFGALAFAADGSLLALTANAHSLWKFDHAGASGTLVETYHPSLKTCAVAPKAAGRNQDRSKP